MIFDLFINSRRAIADREKAMKRKIEREERVHMGFLRKHNGIVGLHEPSHATLRSFEDDIIKLGDVTPVSRDGSVISLGMQCEVPVCGSYATGLVVAIHDDGTVDVQLPNGEKVP
jgi:hypothetical protein